VAALLIVGNIGRIDLEMPARQVMQQDIEAGVEQISPARNEVTEQRIIVGPQEVVTGIDLVGFGAAKVRHQKIRHGVAEAAVSASPACASIPPRCAS